ncbi:MAG: efflux RND transporter permease subunit [Acidobacteria bacterium]|nr:efflux RND transporter permease subunit [Acidobacteriota bacterium]
MSASNPVKSFVTDRPVAVLMVFAAALVFGFFSFTSLPITLMPELSYPTLTVRTEYAGAAPEEVENEISRPIEDALGVISGLNRISSISRSGVSDVVLEFTWGTDISKATQDTLEKLDLVFLPSEAGRPLILHFDPSLDPVMELSLSGEPDQYRGDEGLRRLRRLADLQVKRALEPIKGVAAVRVRGGLEEEIHIELNEAELTRTQLSVQDVINRLQQENINVAGGTIKEGRAEYMIRTLNEYEDLDQISDTIVAKLEGKPVRIKDIGQVVRSNKEVEIITQTDGRASVQIEIYKEADANMVSLAKAVTEAIGDIPKKDEKPEPQPDEARKGLPRIQRAQGLAAQLHDAEGARLQVVADRSKFIESSINEVKNTALMGGLLAILILFLFLNNTKSTAIIAVSIPMSLLITFAPMNLAGVSLNIMSLGGLALGIGMLVDSSIVVLESIFRCREEGDDIRTAAIRGTKEVRAAVFASTLTSIAVFFPMVFVHGIAGQAFGDLGLAVVISLLASYVVAVAFIPMLASRKGVGQMQGLTVRPKIFQITCFRLMLDGFSSLWAWCRKKAWRFLLLPLGFLYILIRTLIHLVFEILKTGFMGIFTLLVSLVWDVAVPFTRRVFGLIFFFPLKLAEKLLNGILGLYTPLLKWSVQNTGTIFVVVILCFLAIFGFITRLGNELLPEIHQGEFTFDVQLPVGTPVEDTYRILSEVEKRVLQDKTDIRNLLVTYGYDVANSKSSDEGEHTAKFKVLLSKSSDPAQAEARVIQRIRSYFQQLPDTGVNVSRPVLFSAKTPIEIEIQSDNLVALRAKSLEVKSVLSQLPELADVETSLRQGAPEIQVIYDRNKMLQYGLNIGTVARQVRDLIKGNEATRFNRVDRRIPIVVQLQEADRKSLEDVSQIIVNPGGDHPIPLYAIAELKMGEGSSEVRRIDGRRVALVSANVSLGSLGQAVEKINTTLNNQIDWPDDLSFYIAGQNQEWEKSKSSLFLALALSIFLVYVIMAAQFESLLHPFIIMFSIPLAFVGTLASLYLFHINLSIVVFLGMIMLAGIVVNNAIVLVDYINTLRGRGMELIEAVITAGQVRLRPILMTTATTVLGLLPMALGLGDGAEIRTPMANAVISGLFSSTLLTLLVIPSLYVVLERFKLKFFVTENEAIGAQAP